MKKKSLILPILVIVISIVFSSIMIFYTTDYAFIKSVRNNKISGDIRCVPLLEKAYEIDPSYTKLERLKIIYTYEQFYHAPEYDAFYFNNSELPEDFMEKCVKYSKLYYDYTVNPESVIKRKTLYANRYEIPVLDKDIEKNDAFVQYAASLYLCGQKAEAQKLIENWLSEKDEYLGLLYRFVIAVHRVEKDREMQNWIVGIEEKATEKMKETNENLQVDNIFFSNFEDYIPFDWQTA